MKEEFFITQQFSEFCKKAIRYLIKKQSSVKDRIISRACASGL